MVNSYRFFNTFFQGCCYSDYSTKPSSTFGVLDETVTKIEKNESNAWQHPLSASQNQAQTEVSNPQAGIIPESEVSKAPRL